MKIDPSNRTASMGVREFAEFEISRRPGGRPAGRWRMETGRVWHNAIQLESAADFERERAISGEIRRDGWTIRLDGRCDLYRERVGEPPILGEIKTVTDPLPLPSSELRARFPAYFRQLAAYNKLTGADAHPEKSFLLFLNIDTGLRQTVPAELGDAEALERHLATLVQFLSFHATRAEERKTLKWHSYRENPRNGQIEASDDLSNAEKVSRAVGFQAPTGFGKTRIVLEHALEAIRDGKADRILYLTGKTSGQEQACLEARTLFPGSGRLHTYRMRNHSEHYAICPLDGCLPHQCAPPTEEYSSLPVSDLIHHSGHADDSWQAVHDIAGNENHCPYALSRGLLPLSDLWIADYNYLFAPSSRHIFLEQPGFDPGRTWLLIDEAHNLPDRVGSALGGGIQEQTLLNAAEDIRSIGSSKELSGILREIAREIHSLPADQRLESSETYLFTSLFEAAVEALANTPIPWRDISLDTSNALQSLESAAFLLDREDLEPLLWSPAPGRLEWLPLQVGPWISRCLSEFAQTVFFSATLDPFPSFLSSCGLTQETCQLVQAKPYDNQPFRTALDSRVRTTRKERSKHATKTAETLRDLADRSDSCVAAFFPSFEYAETIHTYLEVVAPHLRSAVQPRNLNAEEREFFARNAPLSHDILFLMLGGSFAEAVDAFGGIIQTALIVGPALPELSTLNRIRMDTHLDRETGFHEVCRVPGMRRVNQAIGRLVRNLDHRANIILHDSRFLEPEYRDLLRKDLGDPTIIRSEKDWLNWIDAAPEFLRGES